MNVAIRCRERRRSGKQPRPGARETNEARAAGRILRRRPDPGAMVSDACESAKGRCVHCRHGPGKGLRTGTDGAAGDRKVLRQRPSRISPSTPGTDVTHLDAALATYPSRYLEDTAPFETHLAIEAIARWCEEELPGDRGGYVAGLLEHSLQRWTDPIAGDGRGGKPTFPALYEVVREELEAGFPELSISNPKPSEWVYFAFGDRRPGIFLRYRLPDQWAELVFERNRIDLVGLHASLARDLVPGADLTARGESQIAMWIATPELDLTADAAAQRRQLRGSLAAAERLRRWLFVTAEGSTVPDVCPCDTFGHSSGTLGGDPPDGFSSKQVWQPSARGGSRNPPQSGLTPIQSVPADHEWRSRETVEIVPRS